MSHVCKYNTHLAVAALHDAHELAEQRLVRPPAQRARGGAQRADGGVRHVGLPVAVLLLALVPSALPRVLACTTVGFRGCSGFMMGQELHGLQPCV